MRIEGVFDLCRVPMREKKRKTETETETETN